MATNVDEMTVMASGGDTRATIPLRWVFVLTAMVTLTSLALAVYVTLRPPALTSPAYRITVAMICFSLSTLAGLLFASKAELRATVGLLSATIIGQAALWLVSIAVFNLVFPENVVDAGLVRRIVDLASTVDGTWESFDAWKGHLGPFRRVFEQEAESNTKHLLNAAVIHGDGIEKASQATVETLFVFPPPKDQYRYAVKLQRIATRSEKSMGTSIYLTASPTSVSGEANGFFFVRRGKSIRKVVELKEAARWERLEQDEVEGMLVALYKDRGDLEGDWLQVHTPKYVQKNLTADLRLGLASTTPVVRQSPALWEMRWATLPEPGSIPLIFHRRSEAMDVDLRRWSEDFRMWMQVLERGARRAGEPDGDSSAGSFLSRVQDHLASAPGFTSWSQVVGGAPYAYRTSFSADRVSNPIVLTFQWAEPVVAADPVAARH